MQPTSEVLRQAPQRRALARDESGATIVEMAVVFGLFLLLVFGIIEFSWMLAERNELQHVAGELGRRAGVQNQDPLANVCDMFVVAEPAAPTELVSGTLTDPGPSGTFRTGEVSITTSYDGITGVFDLAGGSLTASHSFFIEQDRPAFGTVNFTC